MSDADELNGVLERHAPALFRCLSPLGRNAAFPKGIPFQAEQARSAEIDATIGQLTDGAGQPLPLPRLRALLSGLNAKEALLYAPVSGPAELRRRWGLRERDLGAAPESLRTTLPFVTHGLTHGISLLADLFVDDDTDVIIPTPAWENYELLVQLHQRPRIRTFPFFRDGRFNHEGLADAMAAVRRKALVILNLPGNPSGYAPHVREIEPLLQALCSGRAPAVVAVDDAYQGWVYEDEHPRASLFWELARRADPETLVPIKIDGATKELAFFASRVGFLTAPLDVEAERAFESKLKCVTRGTVGSASGPALAAVSAVLADPDLEPAFEALRAELAGRYRALRAALDQLSDERVRPQPFNAAYFALLKLDPSLDAEALRLRLLHEAKVGVIAFPEDNCLRLAYCSIRGEQLPTLVERLADVLRRT
jgi:aspartate/methionine/tyrosine aminotransferase